MAQDTVIYHIEVKGYLDNDAECQRITERIGENVQAAGGQVYPALAFGSASPFIVMYLPTGVLPSEFLPGMEYREILTVPDVAQPATSDAPVATTEPVVQAQQEGEAHG